MFAAKTYAQFFSLSYSAGSYTFGFRHVKNDMEFYNYLHPMLEKPFKYHPYFQSLSFQISDYYTEDDYSPMVIVYAKHQRSDFSSEGNSAPLYDLNHTYFFTAHYHICFSSLGFNFYLCLVPHIFYVGIGGMEVGLLNQKFIQKAENDGSLFYEVITRSSRAIWGYELSLLLQIPREEKPLLQLKPYATIELLTSLLSTQWGEKSHYFNRYNHVGMSLSICFPIHK